MTQPDFLCHTISGKDITGQLVHIDEDWSCQVQRGPVQKVMGKSVLFLTQVDKPLPPFPGGAQLVLTSGDRIGFEASRGVKLSGGKFHITPTASMTAAEAGSDTGIPRAVVSVLWFGDRKSTRKAEAALRDLAQRKRARDELHLKNGDRIEGTLVALDSQSGCKFRVGDEDITIPVDRIAALAFRSDLLLSWPSKSTPARLVFSDGSRQFLSSPQLDATGKQLTVASPWGTRWKLPLSEVVCIDLHEVHAVPLTDLKPSFYKHVPFLDIAIPYSADRSVNDSALTLWNATYSRGIGSACGSTIQFDLGGKYRYFETLVGMDSQSGRKGQAVLSILLDGKPAEACSRLHCKGDQEPQALRIAVSGVKELTLRVEYDRTGNVQGHVNWANPLLIPEVDDQAGRSND